MTFTKDQIEALAPFEAYFHTAIYADYSRHPGRENLRKIYDIFTGATNDTRRFDDNCQHCILHLIKDCGRIYYRDKEALAKIEEAKAKEVKEEEIPTKKVRARVKTKK